MVDREKLRVGIRHCMALMRREELGEWQCAECPYKEEYPVMSIGCVIRLMQDMAMLVEEVRARPVIAQDFEKGGAIPVWKEARSAGRRSGWDAVVYGRWLNDTASGRARYWTAEPTEEQRAGLPWETEKEEN